MKLARDVLQEIADGRKPVRAEIDAMARELIALREDEAKRDDGTALVTIEHAGREGITGWFPPRRGRIPRVQLHVGARVSMGGRIYGVVAVESDHVRVR